MVGRVYECIGRKANKPYFLDKICCNIYSAEELVFCIYENAELLEKDIFTVELARWLEDECEAGTVSDRMYQLLAKDAQIGQYAQMLLEEFPFVSPGKQARFLELLAEDNEEEGFERNRKRGDYFLHKGRYVHALGEYESALARLDESEAFLRADIYHNMGMARAGLFLLEQAQQDFLKAYELDGKEEHYYYYAAAMRIRMSESDYIRTISEDTQMSEVTLRLESRMQEAAVKWQTGMGKELEELKKQKQSEGDSVYEEWMDRTISDLKEEYRRCIQ